ncbi:hypothetical protein SUGI_1187010 [Cryptomeria japonica]|nr:hypothetical protein SUGI_1187010 [Cryptomeria japonica]
MKEMNKVPLEVAKHPVGLDVAVQKFDTTAIQSGDSIQLVGIWGMGGSGKTTLAKEIFNKRCSAMDRSSFLFDLRDAAGRGLLVEKQKKLLEDLDVKGVTFDNIHEGKGILKSRSRSISVLIVLDDVDRADQLDALLPARETLGHGSLIVVTTRELDVLKSWRISAVYEMKGLNPIHAKQLFCWHAFLQPYPLPGFEDLVEQFLYACNQLPLSLEVLGAQLYDKSDKDYWQCVLDKLSRILPRDINERLQVSYDALDEEDKEMFLDTACFFIGQRKSVAITIWDGSGWSGKLCWERLFNKCLVKSPYRLWSPKQSIQIHPQQEAVQIREMANAFGDNCYPRQGRIIIHTKQGSRSLVPCSIGLRFFVGDGDFINQQYSDLSRELIWLQCKGFMHTNLPSWLSLEKLRSLVLVNPQSIKDLWQCDADAPLQLRELVIGVDYPSIISLRGFPSSISCLKNLKKISIGQNYANWNTLSSLPTEFCDLQSLEHLEIKWCRNLSSLPTNFGELKNLQHLNLNHCINLKFLPDAFKKLTLLESLCLKNCKELTIKPALHILENMTKLRYLDLDGCRRLEELRLPEVVSLINLYLQGTSLKELPANIFQLTRKVKKIAGLQELRSLRELSIELDELPIFRELTSLKSFELENCNKLEKIESLKPLRSLENLKISDCRELEALPSLTEIITLKEFKLVKCHKLKKIEGLECPRSLEMLKIDDCPELEGLPNLAKSTSLEEFELQKCHKLEKIEGLGSLRALKTLKITECPELKWLPCLAQLASLEEFELRMCHKLEKVEGLERLRSLEKLEVYTRWKAPRIVRLGQCERLKWVAVVANERAVVEPFFSNTLQWPREVVICTRAVFDVGLKNFIEMPNACVLDYSAMVESPAYGVFQLKRPESSTNAILICFTIDCVYPDLHFNISSGSGGRCFNTDLCKGKWVWIGVFTEASSWLPANQYRIWGTIKDKVDVRVEEAWLVIGEKRGIIGIFHKLLER